MAEPRKKRTRDPVATRAAILDAAQTLFAKYGPDAISLSEVADLAGVNRGTAYQHFKTRDKLVAATAEQVSDKLFRAVFGDPEQVRKERVEDVDIAALTKRLSDFAVENPELCRIWLLQVLASPDPLSDPFWRQYEGSLARFAETELAEEGIDTEIFALMELAGAFLWPVWARAQNKNDEERAGLAKRLAKECLRLSMYGTLKSEYYPEIAERLNNSSQRPDRLRSVGEK